jgi:nucleotide-binding universal stress UspA family protein
MGIKNIVVAVAGGPVSLVTAKYAICMAKLTGASLTGIFVVNEKVLQDLIKSRVVVDVEARVYDRDLEEQGTLFMERVKKLAESKGVAFTGLVLKGVVHQEVVNKAKELKADLLVIGQLKEILSRKEIYIEEGERIFREAHCPVLVVKNPDIVEQMYKQIQ